MMAEADDAGAPRKTTTYKQFDGMNSQDGRYGVEQNELFYMENIMRVADGKLRSVPGPAAATGVFPPGDETIYVLGDVFGDFLGSNPDLDLLRKP
jgi:hypothetical protein